MSERREQNRRTGRAILDGSLLGSFTTGPTGPALADAGDLVRAAPALRRVVEYLDALGDAVPAAVREDVERAKAALGVGA